MTTENYSRFIKVILKEAAEIDRTDDTKKDKDEKVKKIYIEKLNCFICYLMYALHLPKLDDMKKAQYALKKFEENPFFLLDGDFYDKELVKYKDEDINAFYDSVFKHNVCAWNIKDEFFKRSFEILEIFENSKGSDDETIISETKKRCHMQFEEFLLFASISLRTEIEAALIEACDKNISVSQARKYIEKFLEGNECFAYWYKVMVGHDERVLKAYMNILELINVDMLQHPDEKVKLLTGKIRNRKLSDLTLPGFVLFFIMGERNKDFRKYIKGDGKNIDINILRKDANILRFSSISWLYNIFYLKHFVYFNAKLIFEEKQKLARGVAEYFKKFIKNKELLSIKEKYKSDIKKIYEVNEKVLEWIEREEWKQYFLDDLEEYKNCILQEGIEVVFPELEKEKSINNIKREKIVEIKVGVCAPTLWSTYDKLEQVKDKISFIDFEIKKSLAIEYLNSINRSENEEKREKIKQLLDEIIYICKA